MGKKPKKWMKQAFSPKDKGKLHRQLGIPVKEKIPKTLLQAIVAGKAGERIKNPTKVGKSSYKVTRLMEQRSQAALNAGYGKYPRRR